MKTQSNLSVQDSLVPSQPNRRTPWRVMLALTWLLGAAWLTGCETPNNAKFPEDKGMTASQSLPPAAPAPSTPARAIPTPVPPAPVVPTTAAAVPPVIAPVIAPATGTNVTGSNFKLREGDVVKVSFPSAPSLEKMDTIRRDGMITLSIGEVRAVGMTPTELEQDLKERYKKELVSSEVSVSVVSSTFSVYVGGCVLRPGRVNSERPLSALDAVLEAGGFDEMRANKKKVKVLRIVGGKNVVILLDLNKVLIGKDPTRYMLEPGDVLMVPEKFILF